MYLPVALQFPHFRWIPSDVLSQSPGWEDTLLCHRGVSDTLLCGIAVPACEDTRHVTILQSTGREIHSYAMLQSPGVRVPSYVLLQSPGTA